MDLLTDNNSDQDQMSKEPIRLAIVEDDDNYIQTMEQYLRQYSAERSLEIRWSVFHDGDEIAEPYKGGFDILLMDIEMRFMNGMQAAEKIREVDDEVIIIFITNMTSYAIRGYAVGALDYVLKPVSYFAFSQKLDRAIRSLHRKTERFVTIHESGGIRKFPIGELYYAESSGHNLTFHLQEEDVQARMRLQDLETELEPYGFFRINKWYLVNLRYVRSAREEDCVVNGAHLKISRNRKKAFYQALTNYMGEY